MVDKILTKHPDPNKQGVNIDIDKYDSIKKGIFSIIEEEGEVSFRSLLDLMENRMQGFDGSVGWYTTTVKLDLEARGEIERVPKKTPQIIRFAK